MLKIYLADLIYDTVKTTYVIPLNIACLAAYTDDKLRGKIKIKLFKYPKNLEKALKKSPPDILGLSNYSWNTRLNEVFLELAKELNPRIKTIIGGPHIRLEAKDIKKFLLRKPNLDYYIIHEGEVPFEELVKNMLKGDDSILPRGCAGMIKGKFQYIPVDFTQKKLKIDFPSPFLNGWLDPFLKDPNMIPLLETNRGCPFGCAYCCWGGKEYAKLRQRSMELVQKELDYVADHSAGQVTWIFCDANFGILPRDIEIAKKIREVMDRTGYPVNAYLWHSKNAGNRNIEIAKITKANLGYIAIQSTDPEVLNIVGRGALRFRDFNTQIAYYKKHNLGVLTDILIGLPGESAKSHAHSLKEAFEMGYDDIEPLNIRLLPGSRYETDEWRQKFKVKTKFRPIFGAYGIYNNKRVFEIEESVRETKDMTEKQLNSFKVIHWLIYFIWNIGIFKPYLRYAFNNKINPMEIIFKIAETKQRHLKKLFKEMLDKSQEEWFETSEDMIKFYGKKNNFVNLINNFLKLNQLYIAMVYQNPMIMNYLEQEIMRIIEEDYKLKIDEDLRDLTRNIIPTDLLKPFKRIRRSYISEVAALCLYKKIDKNKGKIMLDIYRPKKTTDTINYYLKPDGKKDLTLSNLCIFLETGGMGMILNKVRIVKN
jgi:radical SAM superfamily enzyme YgiQ (UPF0313 family)